MACASRAGSGRSAGALRRSGGGVSTPIVGTLLGGTLYMAERLGRACLNQREPAEATIRSRETKELRGLM